MNFVCVEKSSECVFLPGAGGVCKYTSSLYSPKRPCCRPITLSTYTLSISSLSITAQVPTSPPPNLCQPQRAAANPPRIPPLAPPPWHHAPPPEFHRVMPGRSGVLRQPPAQEELVVGECSLGVNHRSERG